MSIYILDGLSVCFFFESRLSLANIDFSIFYMYIYIFLYLLTKSEKSILVLCNVFLDKIKVVKDLKLWIYIGIELYLRKFYSYRYWREQASYSQWRPTIIFVFVFGICFGLMRLMGSSQVKDCHCWGLNLRPIKSWVNFGKVVAIYSPLFYYFLSFLYKHFCCCEFEVLIKTLSPAASVVWFICLIFRFCLCEFSYLWLCGNSAS